MTRHLEGFGFICDMERHARVAEIDANLFVLIAVGSRSERSHLRAHHV